MAPTQTDAGFTTTSREARSSVARTEVETNRQALREHPSLYRGICSNCEKLGSCNYVSAINDTWFCEEHVVEKGAGPVAPPADLQPVTEALDTRLGLCMNCAARGTCALPKPAGGVWFCNEYE